MKISSQTTRALHRLRPLSGLALCLALLSGCGPRVDAAWPPAAKKWFDRAEHSYRVGDMDDARHASERALKSLPDEPEVRLVAARVALAELDFDRALKIIGALPGVEAASVRGRAHWYLGNIDKAADELELLIQDPDVRDPWAEQVARLARVGRGRRPFEITGGLLAVTEMPRTASTAMIVPLELNGEPTLAMIATDMAEAVVDTRGDGDGSWVSLRFDGRLEISDVPAIGRDLSGLSRQIGVPVKMLIGVNLLRHLRATIDFAGSQFVVRNYEPPPPPEATTVRPIFYRGGAMVLPGFMGIEESAPAASLLMNTSLPYPIALDQGGWEKAGQDTAQFAAMPGAGGLTHSMLPMLRLGAFEIPNIPGVLGAPVADLEKALRVDLDGFAGSGLFATFRMTFADGGRTLWLEDLPPDVIEARIRAAEAIRRIQSRPIGSSVPMAAPPGGSEGPGGLLPPPPTGSSSGPGGQTDNPMPGAR